MLQNCHLDAFISLYELPTIAKSKFVVEFNAKLQACSQEEKGETILHFARLFKKKAENPHPPYFSIQNI